MLQTVLTELTRLNHRAAGQAAEIFVTNKLSDLKQAQQIRRVTTEEKSVLRFRED